MMKAIIIYTHGMRDIVGTEIFVRAEFYQAYERREESFVHAFLFDSAGVLIEQF